MTAFTVGIDLGGTDIKFALTDSRGDLVNGKLVKVPSLVGEGPAVTVQQFVKGADVLLGEAGVRFADVASIGLCTPGPASRDGVLMKSANLTHPEWDGCSIRHMTEKKFGLPVHYLNDASAAGLAEARLRPGVRDIAGITLGTGVGGFAVVDGRPQIGANGAATEFGHIRILPPPEDFPDGRLCGCGQRSCAEAYASLSGLQSMANRLLEMSFYSNHPLQRLSPDGKQRALRLLELAQEGDPLALKVFSRQAGFVARLAVQIVNCYDPEVFVIGGGLCESEESFREWYLNLVRETFDSEAFAVHREKVKFEFAAGDDQSGSHGAALFALSQSA